VSGHVDESLAEQLKATQRSEAKKEELDRRIEQQNAVVAALKAPVSRGEKFAPVPYLCYRTQGELHLVERDAVFEQVELDLLAEKASLPGFQVVEQARAFEVYLDGEKVKFGQADAGQLDLGAFRTSVNEDDLVRWLDREVRQPDIRQAHLRAFLKAVIVQLVNEQHIPVASLARVRTYSRSASPRGSKSCALQPQAGSSDSSCSTEDGRFPRHRRAASSSGRELTLSQRRNGTRVNGASKSISIR